MAMLELDIDKWAEENFGECQLGDARRTKRAVKLAAQVGARPDGSTPEQTECWADCKAAYRLFDQADVTFEALCEPHWHNTLAQTRETWLLIGDTTEIEFGYDRAVSGLGPVGNGSRRGFFLHSSLMINAATEEIAGLAKAELFHRQPAPKRETLRHKKNRKRESEVWGRVIDRVGPPQGSARFIHVFDAGADNFEVYCHLQMQHSDWIVRAAQKHRIVQDENGHSGPLLRVVRQQPLAGTYELPLRARKNQPARTASIEVRFAPISVPVPVQKTPFMKECGIKEIAMWVIEVREVNPPANVVEPLHWVLLTSAPVHNFDEAWVVIGWYEKRPVVEDYHKCLKTGCRVEHRQYKTSDRLECVAGLLSVVAVRLLQLKFIARSEPDQPAERAVPREWLRMLRALRKRRHPINTVGEFFRSLAMLGGFLGRKHDGQPGWITIWRGFEKLILCIRGADAMYDKCG